MQAQPVPVTQKETVLQKHKLLTRFRIPRFLLQVKHTSCTQQAFQQSNTLQELPGQRGNMSLKFSRQETCRKLNIMGRKKHGPQTEE